MRAVHRSFCPLPVLLAGALAAPATALAQEVIPLDEVVVTADRVPLENSRVGATVTVITAKEIEERGYTRLADVLRQVPGVAVSQSGTAGSFTQVRIRGAEANHQLVVVDGIPVNQVGDGDFDFADFLVDDIERIEVLRGPQSGLYGSNAHSGVISIFTKSGRGLAKPEAEGRAEAGSFNTVRGSLTVRGAHEGLYGSISASGLRSDGDNIARRGTERDGSSSGVVNGRIGADIGDNVNVEATIRHLERRAETDPQDFSTPATPTYGLVVDGDDENTYRSTAGRIASTMRFFDDRLTSRSAVSVFDQAYGFSANGLSQYRAEGTRVNAEQFETLHADTNILGGERHALTVGADYQNEFFRYVSRDLRFDPAARAFWANGTDRNRIGVSGEYVVAFSQGLTLSGALRHDWNDAFRDATTWRITAAQRIGSGTKLHGSVGTGITNPTFFEQFGYFSNFVGNPNLVPERSLGFDIGIEQQVWDGRAIGDVTYFRARLEDEIVTAFGTPSTVINLPGESLREGVELSGRLRPLDWLELAASYTYTRSEDATGLAEIRRPPHSASASFVARFDDGRGRVSGNLVYNGTTKDVRSLPAAPFSSFVNLPAYTLIGGEVAYDFRPGFTGYVRAENVLDLRYENVFSYRAPGFGAYAGLKLTLE